MEHWYALQARPHKEAFLASNLLGRQLTVYLPLVPVNPVNPRARRERPFFPGYLFIRTDLAQLDPAGLRWIPGLLRLVEFGGQPAPVPDNFIFELRRRVARIRARGGLVLDSLQPGDRVRITSGPFAGYEAIFDARLSGAERVRVLLSLLQGGGGRGVPRHLPLELNAGCLARVRPGAK